MRGALKGLDDRLILTGLEKTRLGFPRDGRVTERAVTLTQAFLRDVGALKTTIPTAKWSPTNSHLIDGASRPSR